MKPGGHSLKIYNNPDPQKGLKVNKAMGAPLYALMKFDRNEDPDIEKEPGRVERLCAEVELFTPDGKSANAFLYHTADKSNAEGDYPLAITSVTGQEVVDCDNLDKAFRLIRFDFPIYYISQRGSYYFGVSVRESFSSSCGSLASEKGDVFPCFDVDGQ